MKTVTLDNIEYNILKDYREAFDQEALAERYTEYFHDFDYVLGDWSYGMLRLKGFYKKGNKNCKDINNFEKVDEYIQKNCAYDGRYFIIEKNTGK